MTTPLTFAPLEDLVTVLQGAEIRASTDPDKVQVPGAWVTVEGFQAANLAGSLQLLAVVYLVVNDSDAPRVLDDLATLYNQVCPVPIRPDGPRELRPLEFPDGSVLPAIRVPVNLTVTA